MATSSFIFPYLPKCIYLVLFALNCPDFYIGAIFTLQIHNLLFGEVSSNWASYGDIAFFNYGYVQSVRTNAVWVAAVAMLKRITEHFVQRYNK